MIQQKHKGISAELIAQIWLLNQGYDVFRNVSPHGMSDIVAINDKEILKIDVKTGQFRVNKDGTKEHQKSPKTIEQRQNNVKILIVDLGMEKVWGWQDDELKMICMTCKKEFQTEEKMKYYCSEVCNNVSLN